MMFKEGDIVNTTASLYKGGYYFIKYGEDATKCSFSISSKVYDNQDTKYLVLVKPAHNKFKVGDLVKVKSVSGSPFIVEGISWSNFDEYLYRSSDVGHWIFENDLEQIPTNKIPTNEISNPEPNFLKPAIYHKECPNMLKSTTEAQATKTDAAKPTQLTLSDKNARIIRMRLVVMLKGITKNLQSKLPPTEIAAVTSLIESLFNSGIPDGVILAAVPWFVETFGKDTVPAKLKPVVNTLCKEFIAEGEAMIKDGGLSVVTDLVKPYLQELYELISTYVKPEEEIEIEVEAV